MSESGRVRSDDEEEFAAFADEAQEWAEATLPAAVEALASTEAEGRVRSAEVYGSPEHAATEAINKAQYLAHEGWVSASSEDVAEAVIAGLRERGFVIESASTSGNEEDR